MILGPITSPLKSKEQTELEERKAIREMFNTVDLVVETVARARRVSNMIMSEELLADSELDEGTMDTVSYMMRIGYREKTGYLMKQSKLLGRWGSLSSFGEMKMSDLFLTCEGGGNGFLFCKTVLFLITIVRKTF